MVSDNNDGIVSECVEVTVHGVGVAAVELMEQDCAALVRALTAPSTAITNNLRMRVGSGIRSASSLNRAATQQPGGVSTSMSVLPVGGSSAAALNC
jgi:hypothetical protein